MQNENARFNGISEKLPQYLNCEPSVKLYSLSIHIYPLLNFLENGLFSKIMVINTSRQLVKPNY